MATALRQFAGIFLVVHTTLFLSFNFYILLRTSSLRDDYEVEGSKLLLLKEACGTELTDSVLEKHFEDVALSAGEQAVKQKRQASTLQLMMAELLRAQERILEQHCINNTRLCVHGAKGDRGKLGLPGQEGEKGERGTASQKGQPGQTGSKGEPGRQGNTGMRGEKGEIGEKGEKGQRGVKGDSGVSGVPGHKGIVGDKGYPGERGENGTSGDTGVKGEPGSLGVKGDTGPQGKNGTIGQKGEQGPTGQPGKSVMQDCLCKAPVMTKKPVRNMEMVNTRKLH